MAELMELPLVICSYSSLLLCCHFLSKHFRTARDNSHSVTMAITAKCHKLLEAEILQRSSQIVSVVDNKAYIFGGELRPREPRDNHVHVVSLDSGKLRATSRNTLIPTTLISSLLIHSLDNFPVSSSPIPVRARGNSICNPQWKNIPIPRSRWSRNGPDRGTRRDLGI
jgi:hypothetical protein